MPDPVAVNSMFARIARRYDVANRMLSGGMDVWWRKQLVASVRRTHPETVLDLATGSGDVAFALVAGLPHSVEITGMDFCQPMLDEAEIKKNRDPRFAGVQFRQGDGLNLPLENASFDAVTISFGLRNMAACCAREEACLSWSFPSPSADFGPFIFSICESCCHDWPAF
jgi:demethylmenaquinone methyltransferase / 2-methoxy-6-polyprenyl-1,4-benzoquinol methylase